MRLRLGDRVRVIRGKDRGKEGKVTQVLRKSEQVVVEGLNLYKKHVKKSPQAPSGGILERERSLAVGKVILLCPHCQKVTRVGFRFEAGKKVRFCKKCQGGFK